jgi:hypothetical protein
VLQILIGFSFIADPDADPAFYLNADPDPGPGSQTTTDLDPAHTSPSQKIEFLHEKYTLCTEVIGHKTYLQGTKAFLKGCKSG